MAYQDCNVDPAAHATSQECQASRRETRLVRDGGGGGLKRGKGGGLRKVCHHAEFDVKLFVGTGLHFEIWGQQGCKSKGHEEIQVDWEAIEYDQKSFERRDGRRDFASSMMLA